MLIFEQIKGKEAYAVDCDSNQFIVSHTADGLWQVDYITSRGDQVGVAETFTLSEAARHILDYVDCPFSL